MISKAGESLGKSWDLFLLYSSQQKHELICKGSVEGRPIPKGGVVAESYRATALGNPMYVSSENKMESHLVQNSIIKLTW